MPFTFLRCYYYYCYYFFFFDCVAFPPSFELDDFDLRPFNPWFNAWCVVWSPVMCFRNVLNFFYFSFFGLNFCFSANWEGRSKAEMIYESSRRRQSFSFPFLFAFFATALGGTYINLFYSCTVFTLDDGGKCFVGPSFSSFHSLGIYDFYCLGAVVWSGDTHVRAIPMLRFLWFICISYSLF